MVVKILSAAITVALAATPLSAAVAVSTITPVCGQTRGGEIVHIHGTGLIASGLACPETNCGTYVRFGSVDAAILDDSSSDLVVHLAEPHIGSAVRLGTGRSEEHTSELQSHSDLVCRLLLEKKKQS